jgi:hypothetical protein
MHKYALGGSNRIYIFVASEIQTEYMISYRSAARWVAFLTGCWRAQLAEALDTVAGAAVGGRLVRAVSEHSLKVYSARRRVLRGVPEFDKRLRDPAAVARSRL